MGSILNPSREVEIAGGAVTVRELRALDALEFIKRLSSYFGSIQKSTSDDGAVRLRVEIASLVTGASDVAEFLVLKSTGKDRAWLAELGAEDLLSILHAALDLNVSEGLIKKALSVFDLVRSRIESSGTQSAT